MLARKAWQLQSNVLRIMKINVATNQMDFPGGAVVKNLMATQETRVRSLGQEDPL